MVDWVADGDVAGESRPPSFLLLIGGGEGVGETEAEAVAEAVAEAEAEAEA